MFRNQQSSEHTLRFSKHLNVYNSVSQTQSLVRDSESNNGIGNTGVICVH
jgi:hypothetical protein